MDMRQIRLSGLIRWGWLERVPTGKDKSGRPYSSPHYRIWTQKTIPCEIQKGTREDHFRNANKQLHEEIKANPALGDALGPDEVAHLKPGPKGGYADTSPPSLTWHHSAQDPTTKLN